MIELVVTMALAVIILITSVPSFQQIIENNHRVTQVNSLVSALSIARSEAVKRNLPASFCRSNNGTSCGGSWNQGWIVFQDPDSNGTVDAGDEVLHVFEGLSGGHQLKGNIADRVTFNSRGQSPATSGQFLFCDDGGNRDATAVIVNITGRTSSAPKTFHDGSANPLVTVNCP